jgi:hypothetical protein
VSNNESSERAIEPLARVQNRKITGPGPGMVVMGRAVQPLGFQDSLNARVPGFEDITDQPDWGGHGFSGRKSDLRVIRFDRLPRAAEGEEAQAHIDTDA